MVDVRDVSEACLRAVERRQYGERYLLNSQNVSFREVLTTAAAVFGNKPPKAKLPDFLLELAWRMGFIARLFGIKSISKETARSAQRQTNYSNQKATEELGMDFIPIKETLEWVNFFSAN
jgi:nucleoside-diphosphate-sugar epimerase